MYVYQIKNSLPLVEVQIFQKIIHNPLNEKKSHQNSLQKIKKVNCSMSKHVISLYGSVRYSVAWLSNGQEGSSARGHWFESGGLTCC